MSSQNAFPGPGNGRPARIVGQERPTTAQQPAWPNGSTSPTADAGYPPTAPNWQQPQAGAPRQPAPGQWGAAQPQAYPANAQGDAPVDPYAPQFEPYVAPPRQQAGFGQRAPGTIAQQAAPGIAPPAAQRGFTPAFPPQPAANQWGQRGPDPRGLDVGSYAPPQQRRPVPQHSHEPVFGDHYQEPDLGSGQWGNEPSLGMAHDPYHAQQAGSEFGFGRAEGGELEQAYEDENEYEVDEAPRARRPMLILAALAGAIIVGGGMAYSYKKIIHGGGGPQGDPPTVKSENYPSKTKPADAGGKQFPYADSKIMGRLGDGSSQASASDSSTAPSDASPMTTSSVDDNGTRRVSTLVVGRDGTIQAPASAAPVPAPSPPAEQADTGVPGTQLVDVFGAAHGKDAANTPPPVARPQKLASADDAADMPPPASKHVAPVKITKVNAPNVPAKAESAAAGSVDDSADAPTPPLAKKKLKKVARADTTATDAASDAYSPNAGAAPSGSVASGGGSGFVAVLASVPKSASSRMDALKRFADMQQKYSTALAGKTPDVAEANLGTKGAYHRLVVGPPGSREQANEVCSQLKAAGYTSCWVTSY